MVNKSGVQSKENLLNHVQECDVGRVIDESEGEEATFNGEEVKVKADIVGWRAGSLGQKQIREGTKGVLNEPIYNKILS